MKPETTPQLEKRKPGRPRKVPLVVIPPGQVTAVPHDVMSLKDFDGTDGVEKILVFKKDVVLKGELRPQSKVRPKKSSRNSRIDNELMEAIKRTRYSVEGFGPSSTEILKVAALQVIQAKLDEIGQLLNAIVPGLEIIQVGQPAGGTRRQPATPPSRTPLTLENIDRIDARALERAPIDGPTCQICGYPAVYKTKRGMTLCVSHRPQGIKDDQDEKLSAMMNMGFGKGQGDGLVRMDDASVQAELAAGEAGKSE